MTIRSPQRRNDEIQIRDLDSVEGMVSISPDKESLIQGEAKVTTVSTPEENKQRILIDLDLDRSVSMEYQDGSSGTLEKPSELNQEYSDVSEMSEEAQRSRHSKQPDSEEQEQLLQKSRSIQDTTTQISYDLEQEISKQVNERVVAPLLFATGVFLLIGALAAITSGALLAGVVVLPAPLATAWYLWKSRDRWQ